MQGGKDLLFHGVEAAHEGKRGTKHGDVGTLLGREEHRPLSFVDRAHNPVTLVGKQGRHRLEQDAMVVGDEHAAAMSACLLVASAQTRIVQTTVQKVIQIEFQK